MTTNCHRSLGNAPQRNETSNFGLAAASCGRHSSSHPAVPRAIPPESSSRYYFVTYRWENIQIIPTTPIRPPSCRPIYAARKIFSIMARALILSFFYLYFQQLAGKEASVLLWALEISFPLIAFLILFQFLFSSSVWSAAVN